VKYILIIIILLLLLNQINQNIDYNEIEVGDNFTRI